MAEAFEPSAEPIWILLDGGVERAIPHTELQAGHIVVASAGNTIPCDGTIQRGFARIDQHALTGELEPVDKDEGDRVFASSLVIEARILILAEHTGPEVLASQVVHILTKVSDYRSLVKSRANCSSMPASVRPTSPPVPEQSCSGRSSR